MCTHERMHHHVTLNLYIDIVMRSFVRREEQEKLNVWVAYMNLENMYGTTESLTAILQRALQHCEPLNVYQQLVNIYRNSGKMEASIYGRPRSC